jgi:cysteine desulfurase
MAKKERINMDYAAGAFGNPSAIYAEGLAARRKIEEARKKIAGLLGAHADEIIFTSGGTESNNLAILGTILRRSDFRSEVRSPNIVTTVIEHASVLEPVRALEREGITATYVPVRPNGIVDPIATKKAIREDTVLVSVMYANNEIGTIQPIAEIAKLIRHFKKAIRNKPSAIRRPLFHIDACSAPGLLPLNLTRIDGVDMISLSGQKAGPRGAGCLYVRRGVELKPLIYGGGQEHGRRAGTENVEGIVQMADAFEKAEKGREKEMTRLTNLRNYFIEKILRDIPETILNGDAETRLANNANISFLGCDNEMIVFELDARGVAASPGSACMAREGTPSHVLKAITNDAERIRGAVRFTFGRETTKRDIDYVLKLLPEIISRERRFLDPK